MLEKNVQLHPKVRRPSLNASFQVKINLQRLHESQALTTGLKVLQWESFMMHKKDVCRMIYEECA